MAGVSINSLPFDLSPGSEDVFQYGIRKSPWYQEFLKNYGEEPNLDDPNYDYRKAWAAGVRPEPYQYDDNRYHWPSSLPDGTPLKGPDHPTLWMEHFMQRTGVDPNELGLSSPAQAGEWLKANLR